MNEQNTNTAVEIESRLREQFGEDILGSSATEDGDTALPRRIDVQPGRLAEVCTFVRDELHCDRLLNVSGVDFEGYDETGKGKHIEIARYEEDGSPSETTPGTGDLAVVYHAHSRKTGAEIAIAARVPRDTPHVPSVGKVWPTALWGERETYDMYGIVFDDHPDLRRILLPEDWEGFPLRKDYAMPTRYHDVPLEGAPLAVRETVAVEASVDDGQADTPNRTDDGGEADA